MVFGRIMGFNGLPGNLCPRRFFLADLQRNACAKVRGRAVLRAFDLEPAAKERWRRVLTGRFPSRITFQQT
jgi:hypothetical protein